MKTGCAWTLAVAYGKKSCSVVLTLIYSALE